MDNSGREVLTPFAASILPGEDRSEISGKMFAYVKLLRPKEWAKNLFLLIPVFFSGALFNWSLYPPLLTGIAAFSLVASSIYILNDYRDIEDDRKHPEKSKRSLASGAVSKP